MTRSTLPRLRRLLAARRAGFSLIEVLIAIVVLALGLLGIAAVFPAVVRQQRDATETVLGVSIERSVREYLLNHGPLTAPSIAGTDLSNPDNRRGWHVLSADPVFSQDGEWVLAASAGTFGSQAGGTGVQNTSGAMALGDASSNAIFIPIAERLVPRPFTSEDEPRFVWDFVCRRVLQGISPAEDDPIQAAVFVRRVDPSIRIPPRQTLTSILVGNVPAEVRRVAVASDLQGRPTSDGVGAGGQLNYSLISIMDFEPLLPDEDRRRIVLSDDPAFDALRPFATQFNQKFVDVEGVVQTVAALETHPSDPAGSPPRVLVLSPGLSGSIIASSATPQQRRLLMTPQIPAAVSVVTLQPRRTTE
jgi:prepilin-type N-terminal cleavage/methylation domain-containing protein